MALDTYANLIAAIRDRSHRNDMSDARIDDFIDLAEADIWNRLRIRSMNTRATASTNGTKYLALPDDFIKMTNLTTTSGSTDYDIEYRTPMTLQSVTTSGIPSQFTVTSQIEFNRVPSTVTMTMQYFKKLTALSSSNTTNDVLTNFPSIYFYGALMHLYDWTDEMEKEAKYRALFDREIVDANKQDKKDGYGPTPAMRIAGSTP
jgi:hypothetical protein